MKPFYDVIIIGGGVVGCMTARALSRYQLDILLIEEEATSAWAPAPPTPPSSMPAMTRLPAR